MIEASRTYVASPTLAEFHASDDFVRGVKGPIGSGKSVGMCVEIMRRANAQPPGFDGRRRSRWAVVRNTYPELKTTTVKTWLDWAPPSGKIVYDSPIRWTYETDDLYLEVLFMSLETEADLKKLLSLELTGAWVNEARELPLSVINGVTSRVGRYPSVSQGGIGWTGVIMDTNPSDTDHWWYKKAELEKPEGWSFWNQPPAAIEHGVANSGIWKINPKAENLRNLPIGAEYYRRMIPGKKREWILVMVCGFYGTLSDGKPVFPDYRQDLHKAKEPLTLLRGTTLYLGFDYGRTPACVIGQLSARGQVRVIDCIYVDADEENGMGLRAFMRESVMPILRTRYQGMTISAWGDPAGVAKDNNEQDCFDIQREEGLIVQPAPSNDMAPRLDAVEKRLISLADGEPGFLIDPGVGIIIKGFDGGYVYERIATATKGGEVRYKDKPVKNRYSHPMDALQYMCMGMGFVTPVGQVARAQARPVERKSLGGFG